MSYHGPVTITLNQTEQALLLANAMNDHLAWSSIARKIERAITDVETPTLHATPERRKFLCDVFIAALEGGIGYWSQAVEYHWSRPDTDDKTVDASMDINGFYADIIDGEDGDRDHHIDADVIERGLTRIATGAVQVRSDIRATVMLINLTNGEDGDYDSETADCIVQAGLFGEVVYG